MAKIQLTDSSKLTPENLTASHYIEQDAESPANELREMQPYIGDLISLLVTTVNGENSYVGKLVSATLNDDLTVQIEMKIHSKDDKGEWVAEPRRTIFTAGPFHASTSIKSSLIGDDTTQADTQNPTLCFLNKEKYHTRMDVTRI